MQTSRTPAPQRPTQPIPAQKAPAAPASNPKPATAEPAAAKAPATAQTGASAPAAAPKAAVPAKPQASNANQAAPAKDRFGSAAAGVNERLGSALVDPFGRKPTTDRSALRQKALAKPSTGGTGRQAALKLDEGAAAGTSQRLQGKPDLKAGGTSQQTRLKLDAGAEIAPWARNNVRNTGTGSGPTPADVHINQFDAEVENGRRSGNANCGPTSLVMTLKMVGLDIVGAGPDSTNGQRVDLARNAMVSAEDRDGVVSDAQRQQLIANFTTANGRAPNETETRDLVRNQKEAEHSTFTRMDEIIAGATASGAQASVLTANAASIQKALENGSPVVVSGTFLQPNPNYDASQPFSDTNASHIKKDPLPWTDDNNSSRAPGGATQHIIAVTAYDPATQMFTVNDPSKGAPMQVNAATLESFMQYNANAVSITNPNATPAASTTGSQLALQ